MSCSLELGRHLTTYLKIKENRGKLCRNGLVSWHWQRFPLLSFLQANCQYSHPDWRSFKQYKQIKSFFSFVFFYIRGSVHRNSRLKKSNKMQQHADIYIPLNYSTCFGRPSRPSSGAHKIVVAACGTGHTIWEASFFKRDQIIMFEEGLHIYIYIYIYILILCILDRASLW